MADETKEKSSITTARNADVFMGLSVDTPPFDCANGSIFFCMDNGDTFYYVEKNNAWINPSSGDCIYPPQEEEEEPSSGGIK